MVLALSRISRWLASNGLLMALEAPNIIPRAPFVEPDLVY